MEKSEATVEETNKYLDNLCHSGLCRMFGPEVYLEENFGLDKMTARKHFIQWVTKTGEQEYGL